MGGGFIVEFWRRHGGYGGELVVLFRSSGRVLGERRFIVGC
jgi:hypothetical protein